MNLTRSIHYESARSLEYSHSFERIDRVFCAFWVTYFGMVFGAGFFFLV